MPQVPISLGVRSNSGRSDFAARLVNCYAEDAGEEAQSRWQIYACDGFTSFSTLTGSGAGAVRGMLNLDDTTLYVVTGGRVNRVNTGGTATDMGAVATSGIAYWARNRRDTDADVAFVTSDAVFKVYRANSDVTPSLDAAISSSLFNSLCTLDGYAIITASNGEFYISTIDDWTAFDPVDYVQTYMTLVRGIVRGRDVVMAGTGQMQFWQNTGAADFPFERVTSSPFGCYAGGSMVNLVASIDGVLVETVIFIGTNTDGAPVGVMMLDGYSARKISPPALDRVIRAEASPAAIRGSTHTSNGHVFYTLCGTDWSWEYDATTGFWHERTSSGIARWQIADAIEFNGGTILGHYSSAALYQMSTSITPGSATTVSLRHSDDRGNTWTSARTKAIGASGDTTTRVKFNRLGQSKEDGKVFEIALSNAVIENATGNAMTVVTPPVHAFPNPMRFHAFYVDTTPGVSLTSASKGALALSVNAEAVRG